MLEKEQKQSILLFFYWFLAFFNKKIKKYIH